MNINDFKSNKINRADYESLRALFKDTARWYNGVNRAWTNKTPDEFNEPMGYGWGGWAIYQHSTVPVNLRYTKYKDYTGEPDQQHIIPEESSVIHTLGNENYIRDYTKSLNDKVRSRFGNDEYNTSVEYYTNDVWSYKVNYVKKSEDGSTVSETAYYTKSYKNDNPNASIILWTNGDCTVGSKSYFVKGYDVEITENGNRVLKTNISPNVLKEYSDNGISKPIISTYNSIIWTGERYIKRVSKGNNASNQPQQKGVYVSSLPSGVEEPLQYSDYNRINNPSKMSSTQVSTFENFNGSNQEAVFTKNIDRNYKLNNEDLVREEDINQIRRLLEKIRTLLKRKDNLFDSNGRCNYSCQVSCQKHCQLSCQGCNFSQCHNQHCGSV